MTLPDPETGELPDEVLESVIAAAGKSRTFALERELAASADCPTEVELRELARGSLDNRSRRQALARHLVTCPSCLERNLEVLGREAAFGQAPASPLAGRPLAVSLRMLAAAAILAISTIALRLPDPRSEESPIASVRGTDAFGFEDRNGGVTDAVAMRRTVVQASNDGFLALAVLDGPKAELIAIDGPRHSLGVRSGEEVLLPLDRALPCRKGDVWLVIHSATAIDDAQLGKALPDLVRGYEVSGLRAQRVVPRVR